MGVFEAAVDMSEETGTQLWAIGVDSDQYETVGDLPGSVGAAEWREHILTSVVKQFDTAVYDAVAAAARGEFEPGVHRLGLAEHGVDISYSGGYLDDLRPELEALRAGIVAGDIDVPCWLASREPADARLRRLSAPAPPHAAVVLSPASARIETMTSSNSTLSIPSSAPRSTTG